HPFTLNVGRTVSLTRGAQSAPLGTEYELLAPGDELSFGLLLAGRAIEFLPYIVFAIHGMAESGLGTGRARFDLAGVEAICPDSTRRTIYDAHTQRLDSSNSPGASLDRWIEARLAALAPFETSETLRLRFLTPTRIKSEDRLQPRPGFELIARNLLRRVSMMTKPNGVMQLQLNYRHLRARAAKSSVRSPPLRWWDAERYPSRQQTSLRMGGFVGEIEFTGEATGEFLPLIAAGELLGVGK